MDQYPDLHLLIGGTPVAAGRETMPVIDPASGTTIGQLPMAQPDDLAAAVDAAAEAFPAWAAVPAVDRAEILHRAADNLRSDVTRIAAAMTLEQGKPLRESQREVEAAATILDWFAEEARRAYGRVVPAGRTSRRDLVLPRPVGPVVALTPWNFPMTIPARKVGAALAAGCTVVLKPAEQTPATALALASALQQAGLPDGCLSVVFGDPGTVASALCQAPAVRKISFTGSTEIGRQIAGLAALDVKRVTLELGGHAPVVVADDVDVDRVLDAVVPTKFRNAGQVCISPTRFLVHDSCYESFASGFGARAGSLKVGPGHLDEVDMGPLAHERRLSAVQTMIEDALDHGGQRRAGGRPSGGPGYFFEPTVISGVDPQARALREEPFGPIAIIQPFEDLDHAVTLANDVPYGLAGYAFTRSLETSHELSERIEVGMLGINHLAIQGPQTPFGGVKASGYGSEGGTEGLAEFLQPRLVSYGDIT